MHVSVCLGLDLAGGYQYRHGVLPGTGAQSPRTQIPHFAQESLGFGNMPIRFCPEFVVGHVLQELSSWPLHNLYHSSISLEGSAQCKVDYRSETPSTYSLDLFAFLFTDLLARQKSAYDPEKCVNVKRDLEIAAEQ